MTDTKNNDYILQVKELKKYFPIHGGFLYQHQGDVKALENVSFNVRPGETLGIVGESGCGKSTLGKTIIRLYEATSGSVIFDGGDFNALKGEQLRTTRQHIQMIFQDPFASLDPRMTVSRIIREPLAVHGIGTEKEKGERVKELMQTVGLDPRYLDRYPHEFSGGQRQRISIARSLALKPKIMIADEPVSSLDVSIQAQILNLLKELQDKFRLTYLFISHNLAVVEHLCDNIMVMYLGSIVEMASRNDLFSNPRHPYTQALIDAIPRIGEGKKLKRMIIKGDVGSPINPPSGCKFHPRCPFCMEKCKTTIPETLTVSPNHTVNCWLVAEGR
ncbi:MAG: dipeptide ABC transporter ATP-binding protein [Chitinivibrionales bacterium]|nr:dipeptide ABC transporter ATP-binding protein [Chitinivibrionales bacterium]